MAKKNNIGTPIAELTAPVQLLLFKVQCKHIMSKPQKNLPESMTQSEITAENIFW